MKTIAHIVSAFNEKFGIPRQSGIIDSAKAMIVFEQEFRNPHAFLKIEEFSHLWLIWQFSENIREDWSPTVQPPRLGGKTHVGVFATRSPFRPNPIGLSSVRLESYEIHPKLGPVLYVSGADLMNGTPIYDIKPYLAYTDSHPQAEDGFAGKIGDYRLKVEFPENLLCKIPVMQRQTIIDVLAEDPRPPYHNDETRQYGVSFGEHDVRFKVINGIVKVCEVVKL